MGRMAGSQTKGKYEQMDVKEKKEIMPRNSLKSDRCGETIEW